MKHGRPLLQHPWPQRLRVLLLACLMVALPLYGSSAATLKLLGPVHRHAAVAVQDDDSPAASRLLGLLLGPRLAGLVGVWEQQLQRANTGAAPAHASAAANHHHHHHHAGWQQHHHDAHDASVVTAGAGDHAADAADEAAAGSATLPLAPAYGLRLPTAAARRRPWPRPRSAAWRSRAARRLERPPQPR